VLHFNHFHAKESQTQNKQKQWVFGWKDILMWSNR